MAKRKAKRRPQASKKLRRGSALELLHDPRKKAINGVIRQMYERGA